MFLIFDHVRENIQSKMGKEVYLSGYPFLILQKKLNYENTGTPESPKSDYLQKVKAGAQECLNNLGEWHNYDEILSWKAFVLRDLLCFFYKEWDEFISLDLLKPSHFYDGTECALIESVCSRCDTDPTPLYNELKEIKFMLLYMKATVNSLVIEADNLQKMKDRLSTNGEGNDFICKRIQSEQDKTKFVEYLKMVSSAQEKIRSLNPVLIDNETDPFGNAEYLLARIYYCFDIFLNPCFMKNHLDSLQSWINAISSFDNSSKPESVGLLMKFDAIHRDVIDKLAIVTNLLYEDTIGNKHIFNDRNDIIINFIPSAFDEEIEKMLAENKLRLKRQF